MKCPKCNSDNLIRLGASSTTHSDLACLDCDWDNMKPLERKPKQITRREFAFMDEGNDERDIAHPNDGLSEGIVASLEPSPDDERYLVFETSRDDERCVSASDILLTFNDTLDYPRGDNISINAGYSYCCTHCRSTIRFPIIPSFCKCMCNRYYGICMEDGKITIVELGGD